jgi:glycosyltransferase involved in cell wall biosynthesis
MTKQYAATVIIPTYNRSKLIQYSLDSIVKQNLNLNTFEVIVVDDGSSDDTREVVLSYQDKLNLKYFFQEDKGFRAALARNVGIRNTESDLCIFIDSGIMLASNCVAEHINTHQRASEPIAVTGYVYGFTLEDDGYEAFQLELLRMLNLSDVDQTITHLKRLNKYLDQRETYYRRHNDAIDRLPAPWITFWTCHVSVRRQDLMNVGLFDENFTLWATEDIELGFRLFQHGVKIILSREATAVHYPHHKDFTENWKTKRFNLAYFHKKHQHPITKLLLTNMWDELNDSIISEQHAGNLSLAKEMA